MNYLVSIAPIIMLLFISPESFPYDYYLYLRWIVCGSAIYTAYMASKQKKGSFLAFFVIAAILFNPLMPFQLSRDLWSIIHVVVSLGFAGSLFVVKSKKPILDKSQLKNPN